MKQLNYVDGSSADGCQVTNEHAARALAQGHPKSRPGMALDAGTAREGEDRQPGAVPIGAFQS